LEIGDWGAHSAGSKHVIMTIGVAAEKAVEPPY